MTPLNNVDTLLFDMDGTLTNLGTRYWAPFFRAFDHLKPDYDKEKRQEVFERTLTEVMQTSEGRSRTLKLKLFWRASRDLELSIIDLFKGMRFILKDPLAFKELVPLEGVEKTVEELHKRGYKLGLVTNAGDKTVGRAKRKLEMMEHFDVFVTRNSVKKMKPYPEPILLACEKLSKPPEECVMIGDFPQDVRAGKAAGTKTIGIIGINGKYTANELRSTEPDVLLSSFEELLEVFPNR